MSEKQISPAGIKLANSAMAEAEAIQERTIQDQALGYVPKALKTLGKFAAGQQVNKVKPSPQVMRAAARDIVEFAGGRPETRDPRIGSDGASLTIQIMQFGSGEPATILSGGREVPLLRGDAFTEAEHARTSVAESFEVPDAARHPDEDS